MKHWHLIAYDIRDPHRLRRVHYYISKRATALQRSVFVVRAKPVELKALLDGIRERVNDHADDVRVYPVWRPETFWTSGQQAAAVAGMYGADRRDDKQRRATGFFGKLLAGIRKGEKK